VRVVAKRVSNKPISRRKFLRRCGQGAVALGAASCLPGVEGEWGSCQETDGGSPPVPESNRVIQVYSAEVLDPQTFEVRPDELARMLQAGLESLTGKASPAEAWGQVLAGRNPVEPIGLKVNALNPRVPTSPGLVGRLARSLTTLAGIPPEEIFAWDRTELELRQAGITSESVGVACRGTQLSHDDSSGPGYETEPVCLSGQNIQLARLLTAEAAHLVNVSVMKNHKAAGFSGCLKNHYGSFPNPGDFHEGIEEHVARLNVLSPIASTSRLFIIDALKGVCIGDTDGPADCAPSMLLLSFDPVAIDRRGLEIRDQMREQKGEAKGLPAPYLELAEDLGLGTNDYELVALDL